MSILTPNGVPAGCRVEEWVAAVVVDRDDNKANASALAYRDGAPPTARRADLDTANKQ